MTVEHVSTRPIASTVVESESGQSLTRALETGGTVIGCVTGWVVVVGIFLGASVIGTICIGGTAVMLAAAFLAPAGAGG